MSQPRVFVTLGRSGQVVERSGKGSNYRELRGDIGPSAGSKRSRGDASTDTSKRQQNGTARRPRDSGVDGTRLNPNDLRLKLARKRSKQISCGLEEDKRRDVYGKVPKSAQPSASNSRLQIRQAAEERFLLREISSTQNAGQMHQVDSMEKLNSPWTLNGFGAPSPYTNLKSYRGIRAPRNYDGLQQFPSVRVANVSRAKPFLGNGVFGVSRPSGFTPTMIKSNVENTKPATQLQPMIGTADKRSHMVFFFPHYFSLSLFLSLSILLSSKIEFQGKEPLTVSGLLHSLGLGKYEITFRAEEVDMMALKQMGDKDLKDIGIPMGPRKKILLALLPSSKESKQQPPRRHNLK